MAFDEIMEAAGASPCYATAVPYQQCSMEERNDFVTEVEVYFEKSLRVLEHLLRYYIPASFDSRKTQSVGTIQIGNSSPTRKTRRKRVMALHASRSVMKKKGEGLMRGGSSEDELLTSELDDVFVNTEEHTRRCLSKPKRRIVPPLISEDPFDGPPLFESPQPLLAALQSLDVKVGGLSVFFELVLSIYKSMNLFHGQNRTSWNVSLELSGILLNILAEVCRRIEERISLNSLRGQSVHNVLIHLTVRLACRFAAICNAPKNMQNYLRHMLSKVSQM